MGQGHWTLKITCPEDIQDTCGCLRGVATKESETTYQVLLDLTGLKTKNFGFYKQIEFKTAELSLLRVQTTKNSCFYPKKFVIRIGFP